MIDMAVTGTWTVLIAGEQTGGRFAVIEARERRCAAPPHHVHSREDEFIVVLEGQLTVDLNGERIECSPGTWVFLPRGSDHTFSVQSPEARLLVVLSPAGLECCLGELVRAAQSEAEPHRIERLVSVAARYGVTITGPGRPS